MARLSAKLREGVVILLGLIILGAWPGEVSAWLCSTGTALSNCCRNRPGVPPQMFFGGGGGGGSAVGFPKLFDAWFSKTKQIEKGIVSSTKAIGVKPGRPLEVTFPPVPNLDEVDFGTPLNKAFGEEIAKDLGMPPYKPGSLASRYLLKWSNVYWAKKLASGLGASTAWAVCTDGLKKDIITKPGPLKFASLNNPSSYSAASGSGMKPGDLVIIVSPGPSSQWKLAEAAFKEQKVIFLNGLISEGYDLGGPLLGVPQAYYLKRISKGWAFKAGSQPWKAYLEKPDSSVEVLETYKEKPSLRDLAKVVRDESMARYAVFNDRWSKGFGERL